MRCVIVYTGTGDKTAEELRIVPFSGGWGCLVCGSLNGSFDPICQGCKRDLSKECDLGWEIIYEEE